MIDAVRSCGRVALICVAVWLAQASVPAGASAARDLDRDEPVEITADEILYDTRAETYVAEGSVRVFQLQRRIEADWIVFNRNTLRGIASGGVVFVDGEQVLEANFVEFDGEGQRGVVFDGRVDLGPEDLLIGAGELMRTGEKTYQAHDVSFTSCRCPDPESRIPWQLNAEDGQVEIGGYATTWNTTLDVLGVPAIWVPWMFFPVKTERETGLLFPEFGYSSRNGFEFGLPFFWAATDNVNVIANPHYLTTRGMKPEVEIELVYGEKSEMEISGTYIHDKKPDRSFRLDANPPPGPAQKKNVYDPDRWAATFDNDAYLPLGVRARSEILVVSDNEFVKDFREFREYRRDRFLESNAFAFRHFGADGRAAGSAEVVYRDDRQNPDFDDRDEFVLQRAPSVSFDLLPAPIASGSTSFELGVDYTHFWPYKRAEDALDIDPNRIVKDDLWADIGIAALPQFEAIIDNSALSPAEQAEAKQLLGIGNGRFDEGEPQNDEGQRFTLYPRLSHPMRLFDAVDVLPEVGWQQTLYSTQAQTFADRGLFTARLDASTQLHGVVDVPFLPAETHLLEPRLGWALVQRRSQRDNPLFTPETAVPQDRLRQLSLDNVTLDSADRVDSANVLSLGFGNRFYTGGPDPFLLADINLSGAYDFAGKSAGHLNHLIVEGRTFLPGGFRTQFIAGYDLDKGRIDEGLAAFQLPFFEIPVFHQASVSMSYRYRWQIPLFFERFPGVNAFDDFEPGAEHINQLTTSASLQLNRHIEVGWHVMYNFDTKLLQRNGGYAQFTSTCRCWAIRADVRDNRNDGFEANFSFTLLTSTGDADRPFARGRGLGGAAGGLSTSGQ